MSFYFVVHTLLGLIGGNSGLILIRSRENFGAFPLWVHGPWGTIGGALAVFIPWAALLTSMIQWGFGWALYTIGELTLGAVIAGILPRGFRFVVALIGPIISVVIMGALWGFWYI